MVMKKILVTGASGSIGQTVRKGLRNHHRFLRLSDIESLDPPVAGEELNHANLENLTEMMRACDGMDAVVHLGALAIEAPFSKILGPNIIGVHNVFEAARRCGVKRVVFASSNHAVGLYEVGTPLGVHEAPRPDGFYGASKAFGEGLAVLYHQKWGIESACLRIGSFLDKPSEIRHLSTWISPRDMVQLVECCLDAPELGCVILYGVSGNERNWWGNPNAKRLGYEPVDNAEEYASKIAGSGTSASRINPAERYMGGFLAAIDYGKKDQE